MTNYTLLQYVSLRIRAWWYLYKPISGEPRYMPSDVRNFVAQHVVKLFRSALHQELSPEQRLETWERLMRPLFENEQQQWGLTIDTIESMTELAQEYLATVPLEHCMDCNSPVFRHKAVTTD